MIDSDVLNNDVTLTGVMEGKTFTITIKSNNSNNQTRTYSAKYGERFTLPSCPFSAVTNYTFNNYTCNGSTYSVGGGFTVTGNMTVTCNWTYHAPAPAYKFKFQAKSLWFKSSPNDNFKGDLAYRFYDVNSAYLNDSVSIKLVLEGGAIQDWGEDTLTNTSSLGNYQSYYTGIYMAKGKIKQVRILNRNGNVLANVSMPTYTVLNDDFDESKMTSGVTV